MAGTKIVSTNSNHQEIRKAVVNSFDAIRGTNGRRCLSKKLRSVDSQHNSNSHDFSASSKIEEEEDIPSRDERHARFTLRFYISLAACIENLDELREFGAIQHLDCFFKKQDILQKRSDKNIHITQKLFPFKTWYRRDVFRQRR
jgi:hypothetical protein